MLRNSGIRLLLLMVVLLTGCDSGEPGRLSLDDYEGAEGEALVRHLISQLPPLDPAVPKTYCVVKGARLASTSTKFVERMGDLKLHFVSGEVLVMRDPDKMIVDSSTNLPPVTLQISEIKRTGEHTHEAIGGWAYKKTFERRKYTLQEDGKHWVVTPGERIEGNYEPAR
ncbi:MAG: hypothetical protein K8R87_14450 [Verrucomicrobia bacterium]|nr:hypothetical protein [Verrucomicrobiota bacterium]